MILGACAGLAGGVQAADFDARVLRGSVQLGGELAISVSAADKQVPPGATCQLDLPEPFAGKIAVVSDRCDEMTVQQPRVPIRDADGHAIPSAEVPYTLVVKAPDGAEQGRITGVFPYYNQFTDLRIRIKDVRNPVSPGQSFEAVVLGAGQPIDPSLTCRWSTYGPVRFDPTSENGCIGTVTALPADGRDGDMDVEIVNLTDMHAVGYALAKMIVE